MKSEAENRLEVLFRDARGKRPCSGRIHVVSMRNICSRGRTSERANRSLFGDRRVVVDEELVLANESDVYNDPKGSSGYEQGSDEKDDLCKSP
jgi:hypothetical protein